MKETNTSRRDTNNGRILVIVVGGNISQLAGDADMKLEPASEYQFKEFLFKGNNNDSIFLREGKVSKQIFVDIERLIDVEDLEGQDSSQVNPKIWEDLVKKINDNFEEYEGFVVLHGLDTLAYTSSAISFMITNLSKPIVFTGSQRPLNFPRSDAPQNIYTAITIAASKSLGLVPAINEVTIYLHDTLFRANRASMSSASSYRSFDSLNYTSLATTGEHIDIKANLVLTPSPKVVGFAKYANKKIQIIDVFPGMSSSLIDSILGADLDNDNRIRGVILRTYGMGTLPTDVLIALRKLVEAGIIVMNVTQAHSSRVSFNSDLVSLRLFEHGVISGLDMTSEAAFAKMVVILSNNNSDDKGIEHCKQELQKNIAGEQSHNVTNFHFASGATEQYGMTIDEKKKLYNHKAELKTKVSDFSFKLEKNERVNNIQLRILGLQKVTTGGGKVQIKIFRCDDDKQKIIDGKEIYKFEETLDDPDENGAVKTMNVAFDITNLESILFSRDAVFHIVSDQKIIWSRISIVIYS